jgi:hypothetical protein
MSKEKGFGGRWRGKESLIPKPGGGARLSWGVIDHGKGKRRNTTTGSTRKQQQPLHQKFPNQAILPRQMYRGRLDSSVTSCNPSSQYRQVVCEQAYPA